jgi:hypothetical protein
MFGDPLLTAQRGAAESGCPKCSVDACLKVAATRGMCTTHYTRWKKYGDMTTIKQRPNGTGGATGTGYWHTMKNGRRLQDHVWAAEKALGRRLPSGAVVHHVDENPLNNEPTNLVICPSKGYHAILHKRMRALEACGHADWERCWICKTYSAADEMRELRRKNGTGYFYHRACQKAHSAAYHLQRKARDVTHV